jgi:hypothetical protein
MVPLVSHHRGRAVGRPVEEIEQRALRTVASHAPSGPRVSRAASASSSRAAPLYGRTGRSLSELQPPLTRSTDAAA